MIGELNDFFAITPLICLFSLLSYSVGYILFCFIKEKKDVDTPLSRFSDRITLGVFTLVISIALFYTWGNTFLVVPACVMLFFSFYNKVFKLKDRVPQRFDFKSLLYFLGTFTVVAFGMTLLIKWDNRLLVHQDISFYARLSHNMAYFNQEKLILDPLIVSNYPAEIYHYFNEWLTVFGLEVLPSLSALKIFILFTLPSLTVLLFFNILSLTEYLTTKKSIYERILLSILVLLTPSLLFLFASVVIRGNLETPYATLHAGILFLKLKVVVLLLLITLKLYLSKQLNWALIVYSLIPIFWNSLIPAFIGGAILLTGYQFFTNGRLNKEVTITYFISFGIFGLLFFLNKSHGSGSLLSYSLVDYLKDEFSDPSYLGRVILMMIIFSMPLGLLFFKKARRFFNSILTIYVFLTLISACLSFSIMHKLFNAKQIISNLFYPLLVIMILLVLSAFFNRFSKISRVIAIATIIVLCFHSFYFKKSIAENYPIPSEFNESPFPLVASDLYNLKATPFAYYIRPYSYQMLDHKHWLPQRIDLFDKMKLNNHVDKLQYLHSVSNQSFYKYASTQYAEIDQIDVNHLKKDFLQKFGFNYLLVYEDQFAAKEKNYIGGLKVSDVIRFDENVLLLEIQF